MLLRHASGFVPARLRLRPILVRLPPFGMIITCPACSARYQLPPGSIGPQGRTVRCTACGNRWVATLEDDGAAASPMPQPDPVVVPSALPEAPTPQAADMPPPFDSLLAAAPSVSSGRSGRRRLEPVQARRPKRRLPGWRTVLLGVLVALLLTLPGLAVALRAQIVDAWPETVPFYESLGLMSEDPAKGLQFIRRDPVRPQDNTQAIVVNGAVSNTVESVRRVPAILITALDAQGQVVVRQTVRVQKTELKPGEVAEFQLMLPDPDRRIANVNFAFTGEEGGEE